MINLHLPRGVWQFDETRTLGAPGGFGSVHPGTGPNREDVALKLFHPGMGDANERELEFARGFVGRATQHLVPILDVGFDPDLGQACIVMARAEHTLRDRASSLRGDEPQIVQLLAQVARGLVEAGDWIHRDIKPANVLFGNGRWQIGDFGIARIVDADTSAHTMRHFLSAQYAAPEQWMGRRPSHATDIYALGCVGYELLEGSPPFNGPDTNDYGHQHMHEAALLRVGSPRLRGLLFRMLAKAEASRPTIDEVLRELAAIAGSTPAAPSAVASRLQTASTTIAEQQARAEAAEAALQAERVRRRALAQQALNILGSIAEQLFDQIRENAPSATVESRRNAGLERRAVLGVAELMMTVGRVPDVGADVFHQSGWDVVAGDLIVVGSQRYRRSASLWYANTGDGNYRWIEVAYCSLQGVPDNQPCWLPAAADADLAVSPIGHNWQVAYEPRPIEGDNTPGFCDRWISFLVDACEGRLSRPSQLPER